jgi:cytochrome c553
MKKLIYSIVVVAFATAIIIGIALAQPDKVTINNKYPNKIKGPVVLPHKLHASQMACNECHHTWKKDERPTTAQKCSQCHKADDTSEKGLKKAFHAKCQDCHKKLAAEGKKAGPTVKCSGCHISK